MKLSTVIKLINAAEKRGAKSSAKRYATQLTEQIKIIEICHNEIRELRAKISADGDTVATLSAIVKHRTEQLESAMSVCKAYREELDQRQAEAVSNLAVCDRLRAENDKLRDEIKELRARLIA